MSFLDASEELQNEDHSYKIVDSPIEKLSCSQEPEQKLVPEHIKSNDRLFDCPTICTDSNLHYYFVHRLLKNT